MWSSPHQQCTLYPPPTQAAASRCFPSTPLCSRHAGIQISVAAVKTWTTDTLWLNMQQHLDARDHDATPNPWETSFNFSNKNQQANAFQRLDITVRPHQPNHCPFFCFIYSFFCVTASWCIIFHYSIQILLLHSRLKQYEGKCNRKRETSAHTGLRTHNTDV